MGRRNRENGRRNKSKQKGRRQRRGKKRFRKPNQIKLRDRLVTQYPHYGVSDNSALWERARRQSVADTLCHSGRKIWKKNKSELNEEDA